MARTVADAVAVFDVIAGYDPADAITAESQGKIPAGGYRQFLVQDGLQGTRIGVLRQLVTETADPEIVQLFEQALADMRKHGAHIVDPVRLPEHEEIPLPARFCNNSPLLSPPTGFPAITVPMGFVRGGLPAGLQFLGQAWSEPVLMKLAYANEQATKHRHPPASAPPRY